MDGLTPHPGAPDTTIYLHKSSALGKASHPPARNSYYAVRPRTGAGWGAPNEESCRVLGMKYSVLLPLMGRFRSLALVLSSVAMVMWRSEECSI